MIVIRNRRKQTVSFDDQLKIAAKEARQAEAARRINEWLMSRGIRPSL